jgi:hypothetical protein
VELLPRKTESSKQNQPKRKVMWTSADKAIGVKLPQCELQLDTTIDPTITVLGHRANSGDPQVTRLGHSP